MKKATELKIGRIYFDGDGSIEKPIGFMHLGTSDSSPKRAILMKPIDDMNPNVRWLYREADFGAFHFTDNGSDDWYEDETFSWQKFPNGFEDWAETHHEIVSRLDWYEEKEESQVLADIRREQGTGGMWEIGIRLTNAFEFKYKGTAWGEGDLNWDECLEEFLNANL